MPSPRVTVADGTRWFLVAACLAAASLPGGAAGAIPALRGELHGQAAAWIAGSDADPRASRCEIHYFPGVFGGIDLDGSGSIDAELRLQIVGRADVPSLADAETASDLHLYRGWARWSLPRLEIRAGRQRITFGSAALLRPLMWFDSIDGRDPLQITRGVDAVLVRGYFLGNANAWAWAIRGDDTPRGWDFSPAKEDSYEYGGRLQAPVPRGEVAAAYHHRRIDPAPLLRIPGRPSFPHPFAIDLSAAEDRYGIDGKWDLGIGVWLEGSLAGIADTRVPRSWTRLLCAGADYTFSAGNGLTALVEQFSAEGSEEPLEPGTPRRITAGTLSYPIGAVHQLGAALYHSWEDDRRFALLSWKQTYDRWSFHMMGYWGPEEFRIYSSEGSAASLAGRGAQLLVTFDH